MYKNKYINPELFCIILIFLFCVIIFALSYGRFGMFFIDTSREVYIPMAMNKGAVLYKDIYNVYAPLGYQVNALLFSVFGEKLDVLYFAGLVNSLIFLSGLFMLSRQFFTKTVIIPLLITLFTVSASVFAISLFNYIFPYSYSMVYAMSSFVWSLFCLIKFLNTENRNYIILSFLLFGLSVAFKYEYSLFLIVLLGILFYVRTGLKTKLLCIIALLFVPVLSYGVLFIEGCRLSDIIISFKQVILLSKAQSVKACYSLMGLIPSFKSLSEVIVKFITVIPVLCFSVFCIYKCISIKNHLLKQAFMVNFVKSFCVVVFSVIVFFILYPVFVSGNSPFFIWIGFFCVFLSLYALNLYKKSLNKKDFTFLVLCVSSVMVSVKNICSVSLHNYGNYFFPFLFLALCVYVFHYLPDLKFFKGKIDSEIFRKSFCIVIILLIILFTVSNNERRSYAFDAPVTTEKGSIFVESQKAEAINKTIEYININTDVTDKILVLCEGAMINFLTSRLSDNRYYYLIPPNIEVFGEENIAADLEQNLPDYLVIQPMSYLNFNQTYFCESFGTKICNLIPKYYSSPVVFGGEFWIAVYKRKI